MPRVKNLVLTATIFATIFIVGCRFSFTSSGGGDGLVFIFTPITNGSVDGCFVEDYPDANNSPYILPYQVGMSFSVLQGNCGAVTHQPNCLFPGSIFCGDLRYAYDHNTPIGMIVLAARGGTVLSVVDSFPNGTQDANQVNFISIQHNDGTVGRYLHLNPASAMVTVNQIVAQGDPIALSGDSGNTRGIRHLHFDVVTNQGSTCLVNVNVTGCSTLPVSFRNANPLDAPLIESNLLYEALIF